MPCCAYRFSRLSATIWTHGARAFGAWEVRHAYSENRFRQKGSSTCLMFWPTYSMTISSAAIGSMANRPHSWILLRPKRSFFLRNCTQEKTLMNQSRLKVQMSFECSGKETLMWHMMIHHHTRTWCDECFDTETFSWFNRGHTNCCCCCEHLYLELVEFQQVGVHDSRGSNNGEEAALLWPPLWQ